MRRTSHSSPGLRYTRVKATQGSVMSLVTFGTGFVINSVFESFQSTCIPAFSFYSHAVEGI